MIQGDIPEPQSSLKNPNLDDPVCAINIINDVGWLQSHAATCNPLKFIFELKLEPEVTTQLCNTLEKWDC